MKRRKRSLWPSRKLRLAALLSAAFWTLVFPGYVALAVGVFRTTTAYVPGAGVLLAMLLWPLARHVFAPLGLVKPAYYAAYFSWRPSQDRPGFALLAGAIALHRKGSFDSEAAAWLEERLQQQTSLMGATLCAAGALAASRGDKQGAAALFESVRTLDPKVCPNNVRHIAMEWLSAEAASRGAWEEVIDLAPVSGAAGRSADLLSAVAKRLLGHSDAKSRAHLVAAWLMAPRPVHTFPIVERGLSIPDGEAPEANADGIDFPSPTGDLLVDALAWYAALLASERPTPKDIAAVGRAFDAAFAEDGIAEHIRRRGEELGAMRATALLPQLRAHVETSLFELLKARSMGLDDTLFELGEVAGQAQRRLRDETLSVIEALSDAIKNRVSERRALAPMDEWREWSALRMAYERGVKVGGPELRYLAFTKVHGDVCALAVWLFNDRKERAIANAMFQFLLREATALGDAEGITLQTKNVDCGV